MATSDERIADAGFIVGGIYGLATACGDPLGTWTLDELILFARDFGHVRLGDVLIEAVRADRRLEARKIRGGRG